MRRDLFAMDALLVDPESVVEALTDDSAPIYGLQTAHLCHRDACGVVIEVVLRPWAACADEGFPTERVRVLATTARWAIVVPQDSDTRRWKHRMPKSALGDFGELCLWCCADDPSLVWQWSDGLMPLLTIAHRHLQYEEYWRLNGEWPVEDAPHGDGTHPLTTPSMRRAAQEWQR